MDVSLRLKLLRVENGWLQKDVAEKIGLSTTGYRNIEGGLSAPSLETFVKLSDLYDVSLDYLIGKSESRKR